MSNFVRSHNGVIHFPVFLTLPPNKNVVGASLLSLICGDPEYFRNTFANRVNPEMVGIERVDDVDSVALRRLIEEHEKRTSSAMAAQILERAGYSQVINVEGGTLAAIAAGEEYVER